MIIGDYTVIFWIIGDMINEMDSYILGIFIVCYVGFTINQPASWNHGPKNCTRCLHYSDPPLAPQDDTIAEWRKALQHALSLSQTASRLST